MCGGNILTVCKYAPSFYYNEILKSPTNQSMVFSSNFKEMLVTFFDVAKRLLTPTMKILDYFVRILNSKPSNCFVIKREDSPLSPVQF